VWYAYPSQTTGTAHLAGIWAQPSRVGRVLDYGSSQIREMTYNAEGQQLSITDPPRLWFRQTPVRRTLSREDANVHLRAAEKKCYTDKPPGELRYLYHRESLNYGGGAALSRCSRKLTCP
jgi:hypothetical protein